MSATEGTSHIPNMDQTKPAQTVGNQFVSQYYNVLHTSPKHLCRFYSESSTLTFADVIREADSITQHLKTATGQKIIHETIMNLAHKETLTEIFSVDSQYSLGGSVIVQVTGALQPKNHPKRPFVQTFFLAVQEKGYYVLNDIFRFLLPSDSPSSTTGGISGDSCTSTVVVLEPANKEYTKNTNGKREAQHEEEEEKQYDDEACNEKKEVEEEVVEEEEVEEEDNTGDHEDIDDLNGNVKTCYENENNNDTDDTTDNNNNEQKHPEAHLQKSNSPTSALPLMINSSIGASSANESHASHMHAAVKKEGDEKKKGSIDGNEIEGSSSITTAAGSAATGVADNNNNKGSPITSKGKEEEEATTTKPAAITTTTPSTTTPTTPTPTTTTTTAHISTATKSSSIVGGNKTSTANSVSSDISTSNIDSVLPLEIPPTEGIFIRDIPSHITTEQLSDALTAFGQLKPGSLTLKVNRNRDSFAFVDFTTVDAAQACLEKGMILDGKKVTVEPKRPQVFKTNHHHASHQQHQHNHHQQQHQHAPINQQHMNGMHGSGVVGGYVSNMYPTAMMAPGGYYVPSPPAQYQYQHQQHRGSSTSTSNGSPMLSGHAAGSTASGVPYRYMQIPQSGVHIRPLSMPAKPASTTQQHQHTNINTKNNNNNNNDGSQQQHDPSLFNPPPPSSSSSSSPSSSMQPPPSTPTPAPMHPHIVAYPPSHHRQQQVTYHHPPGPAMIMFQPALHHHQHAGIALHPHYSAMVPHSQQHHGGAVVMDGMDAAAAAAAGGPIYVHASHAHGGVYHHHHMVSQPQQQQQNSTSSGSTGGGTNSTSTNSSSTHGTTSTTTHSGMNQHHGSGFASSGGRGRIRGSVHADRTAPS